MEPPLLGQVSEEGGAQHDADHERGEGQAEWGLIVSCRDSENLGDPSTKQKLFINLTVHHVPM